MPDLQQFDITPLTGNVSVPRFAISCQVTDSRTGAVIADFTGANAIVFPTELSSWTAAERRRFVRRIARFLIQRRISGVLDIPE